MPLTGVYPRDVYADGHEDTWFLVTTNADWSARCVRDHYGLRTDIEGRHRQGKCFWDLARFHSTAWNLVVRQTLLEHMDMTLKLEGKARRRAQAQIRRLLKDADAAPSAPAIGTDDAAGEGEADSDPGGGGEAAGGGEAGRAGTAASGVGDPGGEAGGGGAPPAYV
ncbi:MAG TPA: hypothetical protein VND64_30480 [Pirellulales bacterium]|nr:hypothetical protein [Pirellulales bacterium]